MMINKNRGTTFRTELPLILLMICIGLVTTSGTARADDGGGSKDNGKSQQKVHFTVGPVVKTPDKPGKYRDGGGRDGRPQSDGGANGHHP
jgi:hypothetical protein